MSFQPVGTIGHSGKSGSREVISHHFGTAAITVS
jgi:hypothetical protein